MGVLLKALKVGVIGSLGAVAAFFFDPERGRARRARAKDQADAALRRRRQEVGRQAGYGRGVEEGAARGQGEPEPGDDVVVTQAVRQALGTVPAAVGNVTVEVVGGVATLRGQVLSDDDRRTVDDAVRGTPGVHDVHSFLHLPGVAAPDKAPSMRPS